MILPNRDSVLHIMGGGAAAASLVFCSSGVATSASQFLRMQEASLRVFASKAKAFDQDAQIAFIALGGINLRELTPELQARPLARIIWWATKAGPICRKPALCATGAAEPLTTALRVIGPQAASFAGFYETACSFVQEIRREDEISLKLLRMKILRGLLRGGCVGLGVGASKGQVSGCATGAAVGSIVGAVGAAVGTTAGILFRRLSAAKNEDLKAMSAGAIAAAAVAGPILGCSLSLTVGIGALAAGTFSLYR